MAAFFAVEAIKSIVTDSDESERILARMNDNERALFAGVLRQMTESGELYRSSETSATENGVNDVRQFVEDSKLGGLLRNFGIDLPLYVSEKEGF